MRTTLAILISLALSGPVMAQGIQGVLQGLTGGDQNQNQKLEEAYTRGYRAGLKDAQQNRHQQFRQDDDRPSGGYQDQDRDHPRYNSPNYNR